MSSILPVTSYSVVPYSVTSLVTDYLGTKNKEIEEVIYRALCNNPIATLPPRKKVDILTLRIIKEETVTMTHFSGKCFNTTHFVIDANTERLIDNSLYPFAGGINIIAKKLEIFLIKNSNKIEIQLTPKLQDGLLKYIIKGNQYPQFDGFDFTRFLRGAHISKPLDPPNYSNNRRSSFPFCGNKGLPAGGLIALYTRHPSVSDLQSNFQAVNLGHDLYLSVQGNNAPLVVLELKDMKEYWKLGHVFHSNAGTKIEGIAKPLLRRVGDKRSFPALVIVKLFQRISALYHSQKIKT